VLELERAQQVALRLGELRAPPQYGGAALSSACSHRAGHSSALQHEVHRVHIFEPMPDAIGD